MLSTIKYYIYSALLFANMALAQDTKKDVNVDVNVNHTGQQWYANWWIWGVVALLFVITIVALVSRGGGGTRRAA